MSTAAPFQHFGRWLPFIELWNDSPTSPVLPGDYVDVSPAVAANIAWNLEVLEITTTGTRGSANLNYTFTLGPTESMPFTPLLRDGTYYQASVPAPQPAQRLIPQVAVGIQGYLIRAIFLSSSPTRRFSLQIAVGSYMPTSGLVRLFYALLIEQSDGADYMTILNPASAVTRTGTPPSSGNLTILGVNFPWQGGGNNNVTWGAETATLSTTSAAFSY